MVKYRNASNEEGDWTYQIFGPDTLNGTVRIAIMASTDDPQTWIDANPAAAQALIDAGSDAGAFSRKQELKNFVADNPGAAQLVDLGPINLDSAIEGRNASQETLLLKVYAYVIRWQIALALEG